MSNQKLFDDAKKICLFLIVRNEAHCIERCLRDYVGLIDAIAITDTGSVDNTIEIITKFGIEHNIPTKVFNTEWYQFDYNRNISIENALKWVRQLENAPPEGPILTDQYHALSETNWYFHTTDADDYMVECDFETFKEELDDDRLYRTKLTHGGTLYDTDNIFRPNLSGTFCMEYICPVHEVLSPVAFATSGKTLSMVRKSTREGDRGKSKVKYQKDALALETAIREKRLAIGDVPRCIFYLAQSFKDCGYYVQAILKYQQYLDLDQKRTNNEYRYIALIRIADLYEFAYPDRSPEYLQRQKLDYFLKAHNEQPYRREAINYILNYYTEKDMHRIAWDLIKNYVVVENKNGLFVDHDYFNYYFDTRCMFCAYKVGDMQNFMLFNERAISKSEHNPDDHQPYINNRQYYPSDS